MTITKPMLAVDLKMNWDAVSYPVYGTPKLDGIRCLKVQSGVVSRTFKAIPNTDIRTTLLQILPNINDVGQSDGELIAGNFQETTHRVMSENAKEPGWKYYMFDLVKQGFEDEPYLSRVENLKNWYEKIPASSKELISLVLPTQLNNKKEVEAFEQKCLDLGYEGIILRTNSRYKCGRSTLSEQYLVKLKRFEDSEAEVIGFEELMHNNNTAEKDNFGRTKRSSHQEWLSGANTLGNLIVKDIKTGLTFKIGTGFNAEQRNSFWKIKETLIGQIVKYKFFPVGIKELPRHPAFLGFRSLKDM